MYASERTETIYRGQWLGVRVPTPQNVVLGEHHLGLMFAPTALCSAPSAIQRAVQCRQVYGFHQMIVEACLFAALMILGLTIAGQSNKA